MVAWIQEAAIEKKKHWLYMGYISEANHPSPNPKSDPNLYALVEVCTCKVELARGISKSDWEL